MQRLACRLAMELLACGDVDGKQAAAIVGKEQHAAVGNAAQHVAVDVAHLGECELFFIKAVEGIGHACPNAPTAVAVDGVDVCFIIKSVE